jgi:hypothetical protein
VTDAHFTEAAKEPAKPTPASPDEPAEGAAQNPAQYPAESTCTGREAAGDANGKGPDLPGRSTRYPLALNDLLGAEGFEPSKA